MTFADANPATVLMIGPSPELTGGMAGVVGQMLSLSYDLRYRTQLFPITLAGESDENLADRVGRHVRQLQALTRRIRATRAAIVHVHTCSGFSFYRSAADVLLARRLGCRTVLHVHGAAFDEFYAASSTIQRAAIRWSLGAADAVVALSSGWGRELRAMAPTARVVVIENAVNAPREVPRTTDRQDCRFLLLARMDLWKGVDDLLEAGGLLHAQSVPFEVTLAGPPGTAGDADGLRGKIERAGLANVVRYVGTVRGAAKDHLLRWADAYVQPSHNEGMPLALLEAMAYGLPVVATRVGAVPEVITAGREGLLIDAHDPPALARGMRTLVENAALRARMSRAARTLATSRFSLLRLEADLVRLYDGLLSTGPREDSPGEPVKTSSAPETTVDRGGRSIVL